MLPAAVRTRSGHRLEFIAADGLPGVEYEKHIYESGQVSTRENWHDLFNALAWMAFPEIKSALNEAHVRSALPGRQRGRRRDALTLFDEGGMIVASPLTEALGQLAVHDWQLVFRPGWRDRYRVFMVGHGLMEKCLAPFKAMTANCLLVHVDEATFSQPREDLAAKLDRLVARGIGSRNWLTEPAQLSPLPVMGIPGWMPCQDQAFYQDQSVFRPLRAGKAPAPVFRL